jgi:hypothetical protein
MAEKVSDTNAPTAQPAWSQWLVNALIRPLVVILALVALLLAGNGAYKATEDGLAVAQDP